MAKTRRRFNLRTRFIGLITVLLTVMFTVIVFILLRNNIMSLRNELNSRSTAFATLATKPIGSTYQLYKDSGTAQIGQQIAAFTSLDSNIKDVSIYGTDGKLKYSNTTDNQTITVEQAATFEPLYYYDNRGTIEKIIYPYIEDSGRHSTNMVYYVSNDTIEAAISRQVKLIIGYSIIGFIVSTVVMLFLINRLFLNPIKKLRDRALIISSGDYTKQIEPKRNDEIGDLARSVNQMADSLKNDIQKLKEVDQIKSEFMMIASHNLRTPLTVINGYLEMAKSQALSDELRKMLGSIEANSQRLGIFAEDLLVISSIETGQQVFHKEAVVMKDILASIIPEIKILATDKQISVSGSLSNEDTTVYGSKPHLRSALWNILDNALKFNKPGGSVVITLNRLGDSIQVIVKDSGIGIEPEEMGNMFTKFHRAGNVMKYNYEGTGIGLYVSKLILTEHNGSITVDSTVGEGSTFIIMLPAKPAE